MAYPWVLTNSVMCNRAYSSVSPGEPWITSWSHSGCAVQVGQVTAQSALVRRYVPLTPPTLLAPTLQTTNPVPQNLEPRILPIQPPLQHPDPHTTPLSQTLRTPQLQAHVHHILRITRRTRITRPRRTRNLRLNSSSRRNDEQRSREGGSCNKRGDLHTYSLARNLGLRGVFTPLTCQQMIPVGRC